MKKIIKDYPDYEIYSDGRVYSLPRTMICKRGGVRYYGGRFIKQHPTGSGYLAVSLVRNKVKKTLAIHKLMAIAFLGHEPDGYELVVHHDDGNRLNNHITNLKLISAGENIHLGFKAKGKVSSKYRGVSYDKSKCKWVSYNRMKMIGRFNTELDAYNSVKHLH